ncbi:MAG: DNA polymerase III subunit alpha [Pseudomonadota bacterium]
MQPKFIHLEVYSEYSLSQGLVRIKALTKQLINQQMPAVAITDHMNLFAAVKFYQAAMSAGVKPIFGAQINITEAQTNFSAVLLCQNQQGFNHLTHLITLAYTHGQIQGVPTISSDWLQQYSQGLIYLTGGLEGQIGQALLNENHKLAKQHLQQLEKIFPNRLFMQLERNGKKNQNFYNYNACEIANTIGIPIVATNSVHFIEKDDFEAHEARVCIHRGDILADPKRKKNFTAEQYLKSTEEMQQLFHDLPEALTNSVEIAKRCNVHLSLGKVFLPAFPIPQQQTLEEFFIQHVHEGLRLRLQRKQLVEDSAASEPYWQRLQQEIDVINKMGYAGYFLIVADFIKWARDNQIPVGPGRGSGAGSLVAYSLKITDVDPLEYGLLFERFLNPERISMPDIDIDFCVDGRDKVIHYVAQQYGRDSVAQIITFGTMAARAVVRDVGRVMGLPYGFVDKIAKLIPFELGITLTKALAQDEILKERYDQEEEVKSVIDLALKLEGLARNAGKHAGGVVIAPSKLTDFTALYCEANGENTVTQFDKDDVEAIGLVKFDFLGLRTLTIIDMALKTIEAKYKNKIDIDNITLDDEKTYQLLKTCRTTGIFQLESRGMKDLIKRLKPDCLSDIIALVALFRPGPLQSGMVDDFIDRKHGRETIKYLHPDLAPILQTTYGVILYQEQVMQIAQALAGYTLGGADILRKAMGKKKPEEMAKQRSIFMQGAKDRNIDVAIATQIFDLMEKFAGYGFNKSHSTAYAIITYQTAWLKAHYPSAFMAAVLSSDMDHTDKVVTILEECRQLGIKVLLPNINESDYQFGVADDKTIIYGLGAIKGLGESAIETIVASRADKPFSDLFEFCQRIDLRKVNRRALESLIKSGPFFCLQQPGAILFDIFYKDLKLS